MIILLEKLATDYANISGIKDATADLTAHDFTKYAWQCIYTTVRRRRHGVAISCCGWAWLYFSDREHRPKLLSDMHAAWWAGDIATAQAIHKKLLPVHEAMFCEASPGPVEICRIIAWYLCC